MFLAKIPPAIVEVAVDVAVIVPAVKLPIVVEEKLARVEEAESDEMEFGKMTFDGKESVQVLSADKSWAEADEVIWFAVPAMVSCRVVGMREVKVVPPTLMPEENVWSKLHVFASARSVVDETVQLRFAERS